MSYLMVRATTFPIQKNGRVIPPAQYETEVRAAIAEATTIFSRHRISVRLSGGVNHLSYQQSMRLLTDSLRRDFAIPHLHGLETEAELHDQVTRQYATAHGKSCWWGAYTLRRHPSGNPSGISEETRKILRLNRRPRQVATYWVPAFESDAAGEAMVPWAHQSVTRQNEGIFVALRRRKDILAHEIVHLLTQDGHYLFQNGHRNGPAPPDNLMHGYNDTRSGQDLTGGQVERMVRAGNYYLH